MAGIMEMMMAQQQQSPQQSQQGSGDPVVQSAVELALGPVQTPDGQEMVASRLQQGANDPEKTIAEIAGNLAASALATAEENGKTIPGNALTAVLKALITTIIKMAIQMGMVPQEQAKALANRVLPLAAHVAKNGPDSFE